MQVESELEATKVVADELGTIIAEQTRRIRLLEAALLLAKEWGVTSRGYDGTMAVSLRKWIDDGMAGPLPPEPEWLREMREALG